MVNLGFTFKYFDIIYKKVSISPNGYVCLGYLSEFDMMGTRPVPYDIIVGLNHDLDPTREESGQIYYKKLELNSIDFNPTKAYLNLYDPDFEPVNIFMIKYYNVLSYDTILTSRIFFQIFLSSDLNRKYFITLKFTSCPIDLELLAPSGLTYMNSDGILQLEKISDGQQCPGSNVNKTGVWIYDVSSRGKTKLKVSSLSLIILIL